MPFCTACGRQNPDDARFCAQCGTRLVTPEAAQDEAPSDATATITFTGGEKVDTSDRKLSPVDAAAVDALPPGHALLVVQRGPGAGSRFLLDEDEVHAGRHPESDIFLDDVTVSRRHAEFHRAGEEFTVQRRRQPQRHLRQPRPDRQGRRSGTATRCRSASTGSSSSPVTGADEADRRAVAARRPPRRGARMNIGEVLDRLRPDFPGVTIPKIRFLEDEGLIKPERTPAGYRKFTRRGRRAAALHPAHAARPLPAAEGDRRAPRRDRPRPRAAADRGRGADRAEGRPGRRRPAQRRVLPPHRQGAALAPRAAQDRRDLRGAPRPARAVRPDRAAAPAPATTTPTPS